MTEIKLSCGVLTIKNFHSNIQAIFNNAVREYAFEGDEDYTTNENIESFIETILEYELSMNLKTEDKEKLQEELKVYFYPHSSECFE